MTNYSPPGYPVIPLPAATAPSPTGSGVTRTVGGTGGQSAIQGTIESAGAGDVIVVPPGAYSERITLNDRVNLYLQPGANTRNCTFVRAGICNRKSPLGINLDGPKYYQALPVFRDLIRSARTWQETGFALNRDPRIVAIQKAYFDMWKQQSNGALLCKFALSGDPSKFGFWGDITTDDVVTNSTSPKVDQSEPTSLIKNRSNPRTVAAWLNRCTRRSSKN